MANVQIYKKGPKAAVILPGPQVLRFDLDGEITAVADTDASKLKIVEADTQNVIIGPKVYTEFFQDSSFSVAWGASRDATVTALNAVIDNATLTIESRGDADVIIDPPGTGEITLSALTGAINLTSNDINIGSALEIDGNIFKITSNNIDAFGTGALVGAIKFYDQDDSNYVRLAIPQTVAADYTLLLPGADGSNGQAMVTDGSGNLSFSTIADTNLGNTDLTLSGARVVEMGTSSVDFQSSSTSKFKIFSTGTVIATSRLTVQGNGTQGGSLRVKDGDNSHILSLQSPSSLAANLTFVLPSQDGSDGQALMTDGDGNLFFDSVSGGGGSDVIKHFYSGGAQLAYPYSRYLPLTGDVIEQNTASSALSRTGFVAPYDGEVKKIIARSQETLGNTVLQWYKATDGTHAPATSLQSVTVNINAANTSFTYTYSTATFSKGDILSLKVDPTSDPVSSTMEFNYIVEFEFDTST